MFKEKHFLKHTSSKGCSTFNILLHHTKYANKRSLIMNLALFEVVHSIRNLYGVYRNLYKLG